MIHCSGFRKYKFFATDHYDGCFVNMGLVAVGHSLPTSSYTEVRLTSDMFMLRTSFDFKIVYVDPRYANKQTVTSYTDERDDVIVYCCCLQSSDAVDGI